MTILKCFRYQRLKIPEQGGSIIESSDSRQRVFEELKPPKTKKDVIHLLSHQAEDNFTIFRDYKPNEPKFREPIATIAIGNDIIGISRDSSSYRIVVWSSFDFINVC